MIELRDTANDALLGTITEEELGFLVEELEEESAEDRDYYLTSDTVDMLEEDGADAALIATLRQALGGREAVEIKWVRV